MPEQAAFTIPLDIPDVRVVSTRLVHEQELLIEIESTLATVACHQCGRTISEFDGYEQPYRLQQLPMPGHVVYLSFRPKRFRCPYCDDHPTTVQQLRQPTPDAAIALGDTQRNR
ncbi:MAG: hypothetical protein ACJ8CR_12425 [Roseiflexaceae bacterium]